MSTIDYTRAGSGDPLVLVHGIGHQRSAWGETFELLAQDFDVIELDLPGFGRSPAPAAPYSYRMDSYVDQLEGFFAHLGLDRPHVAGNSLGGLFALELAARGSVRTATAISPAGFWGPLGLANAIAGLSVLKASAHAPRPVVKLFSDKALLRRASLRTLYSHPENVPGDVAYSDALNLRTSPGFFPVAWHASRSRYRHQPLVPVTIAWGTKDRLLPPSQAAAARRALPMVSHLTLPDCGHVPMVDNPELVAGAIVQTVVQAADRAGQPLLHLTGA
ncbi:alpha/beta fold hydrolase [Flexivirga oryzae]|uniref:Pimeloyl-ACP methyl ester carboxylesterase n=1 Tax=Flexivirga oryzae TaxID=1794944 RepID=A0A839NG15_9MICO|nr:alpha/beta hydrolase [Flexivirga oryzae]MBB2893412.1 pimeloyl-ACP methyl ester carboxylesterase [Flexivirga oryzae]